MPKGKLISVYGVNNLGKSTQCGLLAEKLRQTGRKAKAVKIPVYEIEPSGKIINNYLREGNSYSLSPREIQIFYAFNRAQYEPKLLEELKSGWNIVLEDYWATGIGWGVAAGVEQNFLENINCAAVREDLALMLFGKRFLGAKEANHAHESDEKLSQRAEEVFRKLAEKNNWKLVNANDTIENVHLAIWRQVEKIL